jgi:hypothetical protein
VYLRSYNLPVSPQVDNAQEQGADACDQQDQRQDCTPPKRQPAAHLLDRCRTSTTMPARIKTKPRLIHRQGLLRILDVVGVGIVEPSTETWGLGVWIDRAGVEDLNTDGLAVGVCMGRGGVCDSVGTAVRLGSVVSVPMGGAAVGEKGVATVTSVVGVGEALATVASAVAVGVLLPSRPVGAGVRLAVGLAVSDGSGGVLVGT